MQLCNKLRKDFYLREDVVQISKDLLGKYIFTKINGSIVTGGVIVETEAYAGAEDKASHAYNNKRTKRTEVMFHEGGVAYIYLCYGIHSLFNIITNKTGIPHAVLIRAIQPTVGLEKMLIRRNKKEVKRYISAGPGALAQALGINCSCNGISLSGNVIWLEDKGSKILPEKILASKRVGVSYAGKDALLPYRFRIKNSEWTSLAE